MAIPRKFYERKLFVWNEDNGDYSLVSIKDGRFIIDGRNEGEKNIIKSEDYSEIEDVIGGTASPLNLQQITDNGASTNNFATFSGGANLSYNISNYVNVGDNVSIGSSLGAGTSNITVDGGYISLGNIFGVMGFDPSEVRIMGSTGVGIIGKGFGPAWLQTTNLTTERIIQFPDASGTFALTSDLVLASSPVWKKSGLVNNASSSSETIYRSGKTNLIGTNIWFGTGPSQADIDNETLGTSFGHIFGGGTTGFVQLLGNGNNGGNPNVFIGRNTNASATSQLTFTSVASTSYNGWTGDKNLFRFKNGYSTGNDTLFDIGTQYSIFYKEARFKDNVVLGTSSTATIISNGLTDNRTFSFPNSSGTFSLDGHTHSSNDLGYSSYVAILKQTGTSAPTTTILSNTIGDIVWTRAGVGDYVGTLTGAFTSNKTHIQYSFNCSAASATDTVYVRRSGENTVNMRTYSSGTLADSVIGGDDVSIEIRIYP